MEILKTFSRLISTLIVFGIIFLVSQGFKLGRTVGTRNSTGNDKSTQYEENYDTQKEYRRTKFIADSLAKVNEGLKENLRVRITEFQSLQEDYHLVSEALNEMTEEKEILLTKLDSAEANVRQLEQDKEDLMGTNIHLNGLVDTKNAAIAKIENELVEKGGEITRLRAQVNGIILNCFGVLLVINILFWIGLYRTKYLLQASTDNKKPFNSQRALPTFPSRKASQQAA